MAAAQFVWGEGRVYGPSQESVKLGLVDRCGLGRCRVGDFDKNLNDECSSFF